MASTPAEGSLSRLEALLESCYPVATTLFALLTATDLARLRMTSRALSDIIERGPIPELMFFDPPSSNALILARIEYWGITKARGICEVFSDGNDRDDIAAFETRRGLMSNYSLGEHRITQAIISFGASRTLRRLCLDGISIGCLAMIGIVFESARFSLLEELSLVSCRRIRIPALASAFREKGEHLKNLKRLKIWDTFFVHHPIWYRKRPEYQPKMHWIMREAVYLASRYELDTVKCEHPSESAMAMNLAHVRERICLGCKKSEVLRKCFSCLQKHMCEICLSYYCEKCKLWPDSLEGGARRWEDSNKNAVIETCDFPNYKGHDGWHQYHMSCLQRVAPRKSCNYCDRKACFWQIDWSTCANCKVAVCLWCDSSNMTYCDTCSNEYCKEHYSGREHPGFMHCKSTSCYFKMCPTCVGKEDRNTQYGHRFDFETGKCQHCMWDERRSVENRELSPFLGP